MYKDKNGCIKTGLYTKPTDAHMYLHYDSYHPAHQRKSIPYSQAIRLRRVCSTPQRFMEATDQLLKNLTLRGYPKTLVKSAINRAAHKDRTSLLKTQEKLPTTGNKPIPLIINYNPHNPSITKILNINKRILASSVETT